MLHYNISHPNRAASMFFFRDKHSSDLSASQAEAHARAEDIAYTINHTIACTATDFIDPFIGTATQKMLGKRVSLHGDGEHGHSHNQGGLNYTFAGELAGDFGSVPVTIALQRHAPKAMAALGKGLEKIAAPVFRRTAGSTALREAKAFGGEVDAEAVKARADALYDHEIKHLPLAAVWTASSIAMNVGTQKLMGNQAPTSHILAGKGAGILFSSGLTVGLRALIPAKAQAWDKFSSEKLYLPATKKIGKLFRVEEKSVENMAREQEKLADKGWASKLDAERQQKEGSAPER